MSRNGDFVKGIEFEPDRNWIGPVRKMVGEGDNEDRSYVYVHDRYSLPYWNEPVMYQTSGDFSIELPPGRWRMAVAHGMEYIPAIEEFETPRGGGSITKRMELKRWIDLAKRGWYSGDVHVHHPTVKQSDQEYMLAYALAEDLHVSNMLEWSHHYTDHKGNITTQYKVSGFGKQFRIHRGEYWLISGQEDTNIFACISVLNTGKLRPYHPETDGFLDLYFESWHSTKEAVVGYPHLAWKGWVLFEAGIAWSVTTGHVEFIELLQFREWNPKDYHDYLNLGFKLTAAAGSDLPWGSTLGEVRTYVYTGQSPLDPDLWFANLKKGHTFVSNGPALEFTVDGQLPGSEIEKSAGSTARVVAKALGHPKVGLPAVLTVTGNEGVIKEFSNPGEQTELSLELDLPIEKSQWLVASTVCTNGAVAHTSPIYVMVDGQPFWNPERGPEIIEGQINVITRSNERVCRGHGSTQSGARQTDAQGDSILYRAQS